MYQKIRDTYFRTETAGIEEVRADLWNPSMDAEAYAGNGEKYQQAVFEQYRLYVEAADRISARRALANTFFLSLNTAVLAAVGVLWSTPTRFSSLLVLPLVVLLVQAGAWFWLIRSYRQLNTAKFVVVGALEERLPASPYWRAEWKALGEGRDKSRYWPLTHLEQWLPIIFIALYLIGFVLTLTTRS